MKKCLIMLLTAALFVVAGCKKDNDKDKKMTFTSDLGGGAKTEINDHSMKWTTGDDIIINGETFACEVKEEGARAEFTGKVVESPYNAYYPTSIWNEGTPTLPSTQYYDENNLSRVSPMYAHSENTSLLFHNICALVKLNLKGIGTVMTITASADQSLSGEFTIAGNEDEGYYAEVPHLRDGAATVTLDCGQGEALDAETYKAFYIALPKGDYSNLKFAVSDGAITKEVTLEDNNLVAGKLYEIVKEIEFVATVPVESVSVSPTTLSLVVGATQQLTTTVLPENATNKNVTWSSDDESVATVAADGTVTAVAAGTATITVTTEDGGKTATCVVTITAPAPVIPEGALPGKFSVSATKQVYFSKGNLWYDGTTVTWNFEEKQYYYRHIPGRTNDAPHLANSPASTPSNTKGLFPWATTAEIAASTTEPTYAKDEVLFTNNPENWWQANPNFTANGTKGKWRALSGGYNSSDKGEWEYLINGRRTAGKVTNSYALVMVDGVRGMLLFPDGFNASKDWPADIAKPGTFDNNQANWNTNNYTPSDFETLQGLDYVFLPAPNYVQTHGGQIYHSGDTYYGYYWGSNTTYNSKAKAYFKISKSTPDGDASTTATYECSLRLVMDVPATNN